MDPDEVLQYCLSYLEGTILVESWGEKGIFYNPGNTLRRGVYILTVKEKDGANDKASGLDRAGIYRVNIGLRKPTFTRLFGTPPKRPPAGGIVAMNFDFTAQDILLPHPVYAWMGWVCILNPSAESFASLKPYINEAYTFAQEKFIKRR